MSDPDIDQLLAQLRDEPAPFPSVRERVLTHVARERRRRGLVFRACAAIAAAAALVFMTVATRPAWKSPEPPSPVLATVRAPELPPPVKTVRAAAVRKVRRVQPRPSFPQATETLAVKLITDDPDVVIYWIVEGQGDSQ